MKTIGISIDGVIRDYLSQFDTQYRKIYINNPSLVDMNQDFTLKEKTDEEVETLDQKIRVEEKRLITLPIDSPNLSNHYSFMGHKSLENEPVRDPIEALRIFMYDKYAFQIFGQCDAYNKTSDHANRIQSEGRDDFNIVLFSTGESTVIPATYYFLFKNACKVRKYIHLTEHDEKWDHCDILIDCHPEALQTVPEGKVAIKIERAFNKWDEVEHSFGSFTNISTAFLKEVIEKMND